MKPGGDGGLLPHILAAYETEPDAIPVDLACGVAGREEMLRDGRADVALLYSTRDLSGFDTEELLVEDQVVVLPERHQLAGRPSVRMADLAGETMPRWPNTPPGDATGPEVQEVGQLMQLIALGRTLAVVPASARDVVRGDLVCVPVLDAVPSRLMLVWPERSRSRAVAAFVRAATAAARLHRPAAATPA